MSKQKKSNALPAAKQFPWAMLSNGLTAIAHQAMTPQNMLAELTDNPISLIDDVRALGRQLTIAIDIRRCPDDNMVSITLSDNGAGMDDKALQMAVQYGSEHNRSEGFPSIYGVGLNNALLWATKNELPFFIASKPSNQPYWAIVRGPFNDTMDISYSSSRPLKDITDRPSALPYGAATTIVSFQMLRTQLAGLFNLDGTPNYRLLDSDNAVRRAVVEHLGHIYAKLLMPGPTGQPALRIIVNDVSIDGSPRRDDVFVQPVMAPLLNPARCPRTAMIDGHAVNWRLDLGLLDKEACSKLILGNYAPSVYYRNNTTTQGVDLYLGDRCICVLSPNRLFKKNPHPSDNWLYGALHIDLENLPGNFFKTVNNKSDIDISDPHWELLFEAIKSDSIVAKTRAHADTTVVTAGQYAKALQVIHGDHIIKQNYKITAVGTNADIVDFAPDGKTCELYLFVTAEQMSISHLSRMLLIWNGMVMTGYQPTAAYIVCKEAGPKVRTVVTAHNNCCQSTVPIGPLHVTDVPRYNINIVLNHTLSQSYIQAAPAKTRLTVPAADDADMDPVFSEN